MKDWAIRAIKTFVQATVAYFMANIALIAKHVVDWDFADWKGWLLPILVGALSAGISAAWNIALEQANTKKKKQLKKAEAEVLKETEDIEK